MKIWMKISLITAVSVSLLMGICSGVFVYQTVSNNVQMSVDNYCQRFENARTFIEENMKNEYIGSEMEQLTYESFFANSVRKYAGTYYVIIDILEDREVYNLTRYRFTVNEQWLDYSSNTGNAGYGYYMIQEVDGETLLVVGSYINSDAFSAENSHPRYYLFSVYNLSDVYGNVDSISHQFMIISLIFTIILTLVVSLLVRLVLMPLNRLEAAAREVSEGNYEERIAVREEDEVGEVSYSFNEMAGKVQQHITKLEEVNQRQKMLLGSLSHELKTPMTSIIGYAETLMNVKLEKEQQRMALAFIYEDGKRMERLTAKLMGLIGLYENDAIALRVASTSSVVQKACSSVKPRLDKKQINLEYTGEDFELLMDEDLMEELLINLIDNSIKASEPFSSIQIICRDREIMITDHGRGIAADELEKVTEPFYMVDKARSRKEGGAGLGLYIVRQIVHLHEGRMSIESSLGKGTTVKVVFDETK